MEDDGLPDFGFDFRDRRSRGHAARKVGHLGVKISFGLFNDDGVAHGTSRFQTSMFVNAVQGAGSYVIDRLPWNRDAAWVARVLELAMTSTRCR